MSSPVPQAVIICFPAGAEPGPADAVDRLQRLLHFGGHLQPRFRIRRAALTGWVSRWSARHLLETRRRNGAVRFAAGGRVGRLDLTATVAAAHAEGTAVWREWDRTVAKGTLRARVWQEFLDRHLADPKALTRTAARRAFEAQPRVVAMIASHGNPAAALRFDPDELEAFQAGEHAFVAVRWQHAITGDALITADGQVLAPVTGSLADRIRYQQRAAAYIQQVKSREYLVAVAT
ncbi:hypothetical protein F4553_008054 [Allocatelliglobosispora scoriae]|uniref:Uncharacterized protein n=1 Tax=Allocatelliglobosispora scoriae TaxID=643052 RepID=A0A841C6Q9_9ACTN|nr:hypothetical protein [Allocatelliglobosispora scoriae]MBB5874620.1 hypothetical protein [Allocatelliglobosispora scoriae]